MKTRNQQLTVLISNIALVQSQAIIVSFVASTMTTVFTLLKGRRVSLKFN